LHSVEDNLDNRKFPLVLTPHPGEFRALQGEESQVELSDDFKTRLLGTAVRYNAYIVYKSHVTWIASPKGRIAVWDGMNPALGTAGSGDVLSGLLAGILAMYESMYGSRCKSDDACSAAIQDDVAFNAACAAVISHGVAGANLADRSGWFSAPDLIPECARLLGKADI
jgi:NAD(P)H-hydrate repair Nnr-like enzyme with NAD(P)H-hydrate dehydratase domain